MFILVSLFSDYFLHAEAIKTVEILVEIGCFSLCYMLK